MVSDTKNRGKWENCKQRTVIHGCDASSPAVILHAGSLFSSIFTHSLATSSKIEWLKTKDEL